MIYWPFFERARQLNKAYYTIVKTQSYIFGRDPNIGAHKNVYESIDPATTPVKNQNFSISDIRIKW